VPLKSGMLTTPSSSIGIQKVNLVDSAMLSNLGVLLLDIVILI